MIFPLGHISRTFEFVTRKKMAGIALTERLLDSYLGIFRRLDVPSRKKLISKLNESLTTEEIRPTGLSALFGAWEDSRSADEIIADIREARIRKRDIESL